MKLFGHLASLRTDFTMCMQPSLKEDGEVLCKFLQFDTEANVLHGNKARKAPSSFVVCRSEFVRLQNHAFAADFYGSFSIIHEHRSAET